MREFGDSERLGTYTCWNAKSCWALIIHWVVVIVEQRQHFNHVIDLPPSRFRFQGEIRNLGPEGVGAQKFIPSEMTYCIFWTIRHTKVLEEENREEKKPHSTAARPREPGKLQSDYKMHPTPKLGGCVL